MSGGEAKDEEGAEAEKDEEGAEAEKGLQLSMRACGCYAKCWVRWWAGRPQFINCSSTQDANRPCARARRATECSPEPKRAIYVSRVTESYVVIPRLVEKFTSRLCAELPTLPDLAREHARERGSAYLSVHSERLPRTPFRGLWVCVWPRGP
jgi:hypothetical protein